MSAIEFLGAWALRSSILIVCGALLLRALRVKDASIRLAAWTAMLCGSALIPALVVGAPKAPLAIMRVAEQPFAPPAGSIEGRTVLPASPREQGGAARSGMAVRRFDWTRWAVAMYVLVAGALLLRLGVGLAISLRILRRSRTTGRVIDEIEIRESELVASPVTLGIARPAILLPMDWRDWGSAKLDAVLAHEGSHIRRHDPAVQVFSAAHRALLWHSPLVWWLHRNIVRVAEEASDDAAVSAIHDPASYAEVLLDFMQRGVRSANWQGVPMARYGRLDRRIHRILDGAALSRGVTRTSIAAIVAVAAPLAYVIAAASPVPGPAPQQAAGTTTSSGKPLTFEVVSVKPATPPESTPGRKGRGGGGGASSGPGRIHYAARRLQDLILSAYKIEDFQLIGPEWLNGGWSYASTRFAIDATMPPDTTKEQLAEMFRNMLADRFQLKVHWETREFPKYSLTVSPSGLKLAEAAGRTPIAASGGKGPRTLDADGLPTADRPLPNDGTGSFVIFGRSRIRGQRATMQDLANELSKLHLRSPVTDDTGLKGHYDFVVTFATVGWSAEKAERLAQAAAAGAVEMPQEMGTLSASEALPPLPSIATVLQSQLGLKLERTKGPVQVLVIDHIQKLPVGN
jgi:uncharacterized protein (TIGR03435 family)